jgi:hypothetical protein
MVENVALLSESEGILANQSNIVKTGTGGREAAKIIQQRFFITTQTNLPRAASSVYE